MVIGFAVRFWLVKNRADISNGQTAATSSAVLPSSASSASPKLVKTVLDLTALAKLRDRAGIYEASYPRRVLKLLEKSLTVPLASAEKVKGQVLSHIIPVKHCDLSGLPERCTASTTDLAISFFIVDHSFNDIFIELKKDYGDRPVVTVDGHQGVRFEQGAEGEGIIYTVLPVNDAKTLFIGRSYLDERILSNYQTAPGFIKIADQQAIFDQIMATFRFQPSF